MPSIALGDNGGRNVTSHFGNQRPTNEHDQSDPKCGNSTSKSSFRSSGCGRDGFVRQALGGQSPNNATRGASTIVDDDQRVSGDDPSSEAPRGQTDIQPGVSGECSTVGAVFVSNYEGTTGHCHVDCSPENGLAMDEQLSPLDLHHRHEDEEKHEA